MTINFVQGDKLIVKQDYVQNTLVRLNPDKNIKRTITLLGTFGIEPITVLETGHIFITEKGNSTMRSFIKLLPQRQTNENYQSGKGVVVYFDNDTQLNDSLEYSTAFLCDICARAALNDSGVTINKFDIVTYTGFDAATQLPTIALASAANSTTSPIMGMAEETITSGNQGSIIVEGAVSGLDTSAFTINQVVYLSDTPGQFQTTAGTVTSIVGRVQTPGVLGALTVKGELPFGEGGSGSGETGLQGQTGIQGIQGETGVQGLQGATGVQGITGLALGQTGIQGLTGLALEGSTGVQGTTGIGVASSTGVISITNGTAVTMNTTADLGERVVYDPSGGTFTISAPPGPSLGDKWGVKNRSADLTSVTISGNGNNIEDPTSSFSLSASFSLSGDGISVDWEYDGTQWLAI